MFIVVDGGDGCGKSTLVNYLVDECKKMHYNVYKTQEPTKSDYGLLLRKMLKPNNNVELPLALDLEFHDILKNNYIDITKLDKQQLEALKDAFIFGKDRQWHSEDIKKHIEKNEIVISDRYLDSSLAYQSVQMCNAGCFNSYIKAKEFILKLNKNIILPDFLILLDLSPDIALKRRFSQTKVDDIEKFENNSFLHNVRGEFLKQRFITSCASLTSYIPCLVIDAESPIEQINASALEIFKLLKK